MSDEGLKIRIGADLGQAIAQVNTLTASITGLGKAVLTPIDTSRYAAAVQKLKSDIASLPTKGIQQIPAELNKIPVAASAASGQLRQMAQALVNIGGSTGVLPQEIASVADSLLSISTKAGTASVAVKGLASVLQGGIVAVGIAAAAATVGFLAYQYIQASKAEEEAAAQAKKYADEQDKVTLKVQDQVLNVQSLVRIATSDVSTKKEQALAIKALNDLIPENIGKLDLQNIKTSQGISIIREYTKALEDQATAELLRGRAAELRVKKFDEEKIATDKIKVIEEKRAEVLSRFNRGNDQATPEEKRSQAFKIGSDIMLRQVNEFNSDINTITDDLNISRHKLDQQLTALRDGIDQNTKGGLEIKVKPLKVEKDPLKDAIKNLEDYQKEVGLTSVEFQKLIALRVQLVQRDQGKLGLDDSQLAKEIVAIRNSNELLDSRKKKLDDLGKTVTLLTSEKIQALNLDVGIALNDQATGKLDVNQLQRTLDATARDANLRIPVSITLDKDVQDRIRSVTGSLPLISLPLAVKVEDLGVKEAIKAINTEKALLDVQPTVIKIGVDSNAAANKLEKLREAISTSIQGAATDAVAGLGDAIGAAIAGGNVGDIFGSFIGILANGMKEIGKAMIVYGLGLNTLKTAITNPTTAVVAGIALVAAGAALNTVVSKRRFAEGGIISSPTNALIGEQGPEVVFPLTNLNSTLRKLGGGNNQGTIIPNVTIKGSDLVLAFTREKNRTGGSITF